jgi:hypothetical protein
LIEQKRQKEEEAMIRARVWFKCAAMHDPVTPIIVRPAIIGWEAKRRRVDLTIERPFNGEELLRRMKGWITIDPERAIEVLKGYGRLKVLDDRELVLEIEEEKDLLVLQNAIKEIFGDEMAIEPI